MFTSTPGEPLLVIVIRLVIHHVEESQLVDPRARAHHPQPIPQLLLLKEFLRPVKTASLAHFFPSLPNIEGLSFPPRQGKRDSHVQVLQVSTAELRMRHHLDLALALLADLDGVAEVADAVVHFDLVVQKLLEGGDVEDLVGRGLGGVDDELFGRRRRSADHSRPEGGAYIVVGLGD